MPVYNKRGILLLPKVIVLNPKDGRIAGKGSGIRLFFFIVLQILHYATNYTSS